MTSYDEDDVECWSARSTESGSRKGRKSGNLGGWIDVHVDEDEMMFMRTLL
jgi:hypothetical protein